MSGVVPKKFVKTFKMTVVGDNGTGKTSLLTKYCKAFFDKNVGTTLGGDVFIKTVTNGDEEVKLCIWDTAGQGTFRHITPQYIRDSHGVVIVYDTLHSETLENCWGWFEFVNEHAPNAIKILLGARKDMTSCSFLVERGTCPYCNRNPCPPNKCRPSTVKEIEDMAARMGVKFFETSAKTGMNLDIAFRTLVGQILSNPHLVREAIKDDSTRRRIILESANDENHDRDGKCCNCNI